MRPALNKIPSLSATASAWGSLCLICNRVKLFYQSRRAMRPRQLTSNSERKFNAPIRFQEVLLPWAPQACMYALTPLCGYVQKPQFPVSASPPPPQCVAVLCSPRLPSTTPGQTQRPASIPATCTGSFAVPSSEFLDRRFDVFDGKDLDAPAETSALKKRKTRITWHIVHQFYQNLLFMLCWKSVTGHIFWPEGPHQPM